MTQANPIQGIIPMSEQTQSDVIVESSPQVEAETPGIVTGKQIGRAHV